MQWNGTTFFCYYFRSNIHGTKFLTKKKFIESYVPILQQMNAERAFLHNLIALFGQCTTNNYEFIAEIYLDISDGVSRLIFSRFKAILNMNDSFTE